MKHDEDPPRLSDLPMSWSVLGQGIAAARERGPSEAQLRALREGVFAGIAVTAIAASSSLASGTAKAAVGTAGPAWWTGTVTKIALAVVVGGAVTGGTVTVWRRHARAPLEVQAVQPGARQTAQQGTVPPAATTLPGDVQSSAPIAAPVAPERLPVSPAIAPRGNVPGRRGERGRAPQALSAELALLARARTAVASDPAAALSLTSRHAHLFPGGLLQQERDVLMIEALVGLDRRAEAVEKARTFRLRFPQSAYADKIRRTLADAAPNGRAPDHR